MKRIGIISDSHDNLDAIDAAVEFLNSLKVDAVIHAGDFIAPFTVPRFARLKAPLYGVFGNNDGEREGLKKKFSEIGVELKEIIELEFMGKNIVVYHGTEPSILKALKNSNEYSIIITGHTHRPLVEEGEPVIINPGELCGYLTGTRTLALIDEGLSPQIITLK